MEGVTIMPTARLDRIESAIERSEATITALAEENRRLKKGWMTAQEVMEETGFGKTWLNDNKQHIGYSVVGGCLRFKRSDVVEFMEANYFKVQNKLAKRRRAS